MSTLTRQAKRRQAFLDTVRTSDHGEYFGFTRRAVRALSRRVAGSDPDDLLLLLELRDEVDQALDRAVAGQRDAGFSWAQVAEPLGMSRQAAQERWGK
jgi:hypothetical protein